MAYLGQEEEVRELQDRFRIVNLVIFIGIGILISRLIYLQILSGDKMRRYSEENRIKAVKISSPRGMIFDRNRTLLVDNRPAFDLEITPQYLRESGQSKAVVAKLAELLEVKESEIYDKLEKGKSQPSFLPIKIKNDLTRDEVAKIETWKLSMPGVAVEMEIQRTNVFGDIASHFVGYIGAVGQAELPRVNKSEKRYQMGDSIGKFGIEKQFENTLRGIDGQDLIEVDALGRRIRSDKDHSRVVSNNNEKPAIPGKNIVLTIDQDLQVAAKKAFGEKVGSLVAIDPRNGEILSIMSRPSFDPTEFSRGISPVIWRKLLEDENRPLRDKSLQDHYSPGSTYKLITAIAGLEEGVIDENSTFNCSGSMRVGNRLFHCHKKGGHGNVNVVTAITQSCDVFFYKTAQALKSIDDLSKYAFALGLGRKTGIDLPREATGLIPTEEWKRKAYGQPWLSGETLSVAIGQGPVLVTAVQLANAYGAMANGGTLYKPHFIKSVENFDGGVIEEFGPQVMGKANLKPKTLELIHQGLWGVINSPHGTAFNQRIPGADFVGKTGTVQIFSIAKDKIYQKCENMKFNQRHHGVFVGFAPLHNPVISVAVIAEHACHGGSGAAPIARAVIKTYLEKYYPDLYGEKALVGKLSGLEKYPQPQSKTASSDDEDIIPDLPHSGLEAPPKETAPENEMETGLENER